ncbi:hypothetical protein MRB53_038477 [Persea americana]|nr:hypothetical protein MRB53_038477 [Persea americana]
MPASFQAAPSNSAVQMWRLATREYTRAPTPDVATSSILQQPKQRLQSAPNSQVSSPNVSPPNTYSSAYSGNPGSYIARNVNDDISPFAGHHHRPMHINILDTAASQVERENNTQLPRPISSFSSRSQNSWHSNYARPYGTVHDQYHNRATKKSRPGPPFSTATLSPEFLHEKVPVARFASVMHISWNGTLFGGSVGSIFNGTPKPGFMLPSTPNHRHSSSLPSFIQSVSRALLVFAASIPLYSDTLIFGCLPALPSLGSRWCLLVLLQLFKSLISLPDFIILVLTALCKFNSLVASRVSSTTAAN